MKVLFTGASSFTGYWFIRELAQAGYEVIACFQKSKEHYEGIRRERVNQLQKLCTPIFHCSFGSENFLNQTKSYDNLDLYCHHAADVNHYKAPEFNCLKAVANNTCNLQVVLKTLKAQGCNKIVLTGSVFEQNEGYGSDDLKAISPYGLSKGITSEIFRFYCDHYGFRLGKFVIPNPFGPYEEARFTSYLIKTWYTNKIAVVSTPDYIRDNIHVTLLAKAYRYFIDSMDPQHGFSKMSPSGYVESQGHFAFRFAQEMQFRLNLPCRLDCKSQIEFPEPKIRVNTLPIQKQIENWDEKQAWNDLALYYKEFKGEL